ncbi:HD-GYP domain-containing protein [Roseibium aestuarii]|uniref:HD-GYP domain-containing protein n=1 Tax=Roseibium aestuarii TaxID=2600299 RepID=A0ABW4JVY1_9HYPH|nr:HD domain-containing phosphohydrolase [Roseibium aestuarii]
MKPIVVVTQTEAHLPPSLQDLQLLYRVERVSFEEITPARLAESSLGLISMARVEREHADRLKAVLEAEPGIRCIGMVSPERRQETVQAQALGLADLWDRDEPASLAVGKIRRLLGTYGVPALADDIPEATRVGVLEACEAFETAVMSTVVGEALPLGSCNRAVSAIMSALKVDGLTVWLSTVQNHHSPTFCHSLMVTGLVLQFVDVLGVTERDSVQMGIGAMLHDLGKVKLPLAVLDKPVEQLSEEERNLIALHPEYADVILKGQPAVPAIVRNMMVAHHEYLDGTGYPMGLMGDEISACLRILSICNLYAGMIDRYRNDHPSSPRQAFATLFGMGRKLDADLLALFREVVLDRETVAPRPGRMDMPRLIN